MISQTLPPRHHPANYTALADFRYEIRRFLRVSEEAARAEGLEPQQHQLLLALKGAPAETAPTIAWLAERLQITHHSVVGLVDRLEERRLVRRRRDPEDHRRARVALTGPGEAILQRLSLLHQDELRSRARALVSALVAIVKAPVTRR
jgi:DNA-binding MarR family transcriptional regulator